MSFRIEKEEYVNRTFRISKQLVSQMETICNEKGISLNKLVVMCIQYALSHIDEKQDDTTQS